MTFLKKHWGLTLFVITVLGISGYLLYLSQQLPKLNEAPAPPASQAGEPPAQPKPPVGDTSQGGHWYGDEWHAEPHETPQLQVISVDPQAWQKLDDEAFYHYMNEAKKSLAEYKPPYTTKYIEAQRAIQVNFDAFYAKKNALSIEKERERHGLAERRNEVMAELANIPVEDKVRREELLRILFELSQTVRANANLEENSP